MTTTFTFTAGRPFARANSITTYGANLLLPCYTGATVFTSGATLLQALALTVNLSAVRGWMAATTDAAGNAWILPVNGSNILKLPVAGPSGASLINASVKPAWTGIASISTTTYALSSDGNLYSVSGSTLSAVSGGSFGSETVGLETDGTKLYTLLPTVSDLGIFVGGTASTVATPMTTPSCLAANTGGSVAVGGWSAFTISHATTTIAASPISPTTTSTAISTSGNAVYMITGTDPVWAVTQTLTGTGAPSSLTWVPNGQQVMVCDKTNGKLQIYNLASLTLTAGTLLTMTGVSSVACTPDSTMAVATQPGSNQLRVLNNSLGIWSLGATIADTNTPQVILDLTQTEMVYGITGGITFLEFVTAAWTVGTRVTGFGYNVTGLTTDGNGLIFAIGTAAGVGHLTIASKTGGILASTTWTGSADAILWSQGQIFIVDTTSTLVRPFSFYQGALHAQTTIVPPAGCAGIALVGESVWLSGSSTLAQFQQTSPYVLKTMAVGEISIYASSAWTSVMLPTGKRPSAVTFDGSGNVWAATEQNDIYEVSAAGSILSHTTVAVFPGQVAGTTMGFSSLLWSGGHLYASSSLPGALVEIQ